jgi:hypothetical protein
LFFTIGPCSFILKVIGNSRPLEWPLLHGYPNATRTKTGKIGLAIDAREDDDDYDINMAHIDTTPRFGDMISETTFPKLVNEVDFTDNRTLINNVKSAVDQARFRKVLDRSRRAEYVPALSPLFMTGNPPPPFHDGALMKRLACRYHSQNETHFKDEQAAKDFDALVSEACRLRSLGLFRNRFVMDNQQLILDKKLGPLEKARKILVSAYEAAGMLAPCWLMTKQLEQNYLQESIGNAKDAVLNGFEAMIIDKIKNLKGINDLQAYTKTSDRFYILVDNHNTAFCTTN